MLLFRGLWALREPVCRPPVDRECSSC